MNVLFNRRFVNESGTDLIPGKIHTIRANYDYWKQRADGKICSLRVWEGKPHRSKQIEVCKKMVHVQKVFKCTLVNTSGFTIGADFFLENNKKINKELLCLNDGLNVDEFNECFKDYECGFVAILHFTDFRY